MAREAYYLSAIQKARASVFRDCGKCVNGFVRDKKRRSAVDSISDYESECECRAIANRKAVLIASGIPESIDPGDGLKVDTRSKEQLVHYMSKIDQALEKGIGIIFCSESGFERSENDVARARVLSSFMVLTRAIEKGHTAHYIDTNRYCDIKKSAGFHNHDINEFIGEVNAVDFLCLGRVGSVIRNEYAFNTISSLIIDRAIHKKPIILITNQTDRQFYGLYGSDVASYVQPMIAKISITSFFGNKKGYVDLKKEL